MKTRLTVIIGFMAAGLTALAYDPFNVGDLYDIRIVNARTNAGELLDITDTSPLGNVGIVLGGRDAGEPLDMTDAFQVGNIGIAITRRNAGEPLHITLVLPNSPAEGAGVKANWYIISVDGTNVVSAPSGRCMSMVHGAVGTSVTLELADPQRNQTNRFTIKRADVAFPDDLIRSMALPQLRTNFPSKPFAPKSFLIAQ